MLGTVFGSEPVGEANEVGLVNRVQYLGRRPAGRPCPPVRAPRAVAAPRRPSGMNALRTGFARYAPRRSLIGQVLGRWLSSCLSVLPATSAPSTPAEASLFKARSTRSRKPFGCRTRGARSVSELLQLPIVAYGDLSYPVQRTLQHLPDLCARSLSCAHRRVPLGQTPFPPPPPPPVARLCSAASQVLWSRPTSHDRPSPACVLRLSGATCAPSCRRWSWDLPVPCEVLPCVLGVSDRAGSACVSR